MQSLPISREMERAPANDLHAGLPRPHKALQRATAATKRCDGRRLDIPREAGNQVRRSKDDRPLKTHECMA